MGNSSILSEDLSRISSLLDSRWDSDPKKSYVSYLFHNGDNAILKKIGEEATEVILAAKDFKRETPNNNLVAEMADLWFHCLVLLSYYKLSPEHIITELKNREGFSGITEKATRC